ncbi:MAG: hypothetical protein NT062_22990 [Proteobacteria bacterium]|nr:hypothetical protein [Pseudomonadota bacterium]
MRPWFSIPAAGLCGAALGALAGGLPGALALGLAAAAMTAAARALMGDSPAALAAAIVAALVLAATLVDRDLAGVRQALAVAALAWTIAELARATAPDSSPVVAMLPAVVAGILDASLVPLIPIAGLRLVTAPWKRPRWVVGVPIVGAIATLIAIVACASHGGGLGEAWAGRHAAPRALRALASGHLDALGPFVVVGAAAGLATLVARGRYVQAALVVAIVGALLGDLRAGAIGAPTIALATLFCALAIGRLAASIRLPSGQAIVAATIGLIVVLPPTWSLVHS